MKAIIAILTAVIYCLICSCYTKNQAINKFCKQDTISTFVTIHDTIRTETIQADTTFADSNDTVILERDKMVIRYIHKDRKVYLYGECKGDTFYITKTVSVKIPALVPKPAAPTFWEKVFLQVKNALALIGLTILVILTIRYIISKLSK